MKYTEFVKTNYDKVSHLPPKQRMAELGKMWKKSGHASGKGVVGGSEGGMFIKRKGGAKGKGRVKKVRGKGILSTALDAFGLGMPEDAGKGVAGGKMKRTRKMKRVRGKGIISDALGAIGLGMPEDAGKGVAGGDVEGKGILSTALDAFGLGVHKKGRGRPSKGKGVVGGSVAGGDVTGGGLTFFDALKTIIGLGVPNKIKQKHYNRMVALEKHLHTKGKLTPAQHNKLKVYHTLHGQGFFDSLWSGIKKGASAVASVVPHAISAIPQVLKVVPEVAKFVPAVGKLAAPLAKVAPLAALL